MIPISVTPQKGVNLYHQIVQQIRFGILGGKITPGTQLPSVRELSRKLGIHPLTVAKAYLQLEQETLVVTRWGKGTFVAPRGPQSAAHANKGRLKEVADRFILEALPLADHPGEILEIIRARLKGLKT